MSAHLTTNVNGDTKVTFHFPNTLARYNVGITYTYREGPSKRISPMGAVSNGYFVVLKRPSRYDDEGYISTDPLLTLYSDGRKLGKKERFWFTRPFTRTGAQLTDKIHLVVFVILLACWLMIFG
jgi:hypothetical protein